MKHLYALYYVIFLSALVSGLCFGTHPVKAEEAPILASLVTIDKKQVNITQVFETIREQSGVNVKIQGNKPSAKRDVILPEMPMNQAIKKVLKLYGIESHAAVYNFDTKDVLLVILQASAMPDTLPAEAVAEKEGIKFMTAAEFAALTPGKTDDSKHMTPEEFKKLPRGKPANSKYMTPMENRPIQST